LRKVKVYSISKLKTIDEGMHEGIQNDSEMRVECQEENYSSWSISYPSIKIQFWYNKLESRRNKKKLTGKLERCQQCIKVITQKLIEAVKRRRKRLVTN
jgi:hypothetical protein